MTDEMDFSVAMRLVLSDGVRIARRYWTTNEYRLDSIDGFDGRHFDAWIGALCPRDIGLQPTVATGSCAATMRWTWDRNDASLVLYLARRRNALDQDGIRHQYVTFGWGPTLEETLARDWYVVRR